MFPSLFNTYKKGDKMNIYELYELYLEYCVEKGEIPLNFKDWLIETEPVKNKE